MKLPAQRWPRPRREQESTNMEQNMTDPLTDIADALAVLIAVAVLLATGFGWLQ